MEVTPAVPSPSRLWNFSYPPRMEWVNLPPPLTKSAPPTKAGTLLRDW